MTSGKAGGTGFEPLNRSFKTIIAGNQPVIEFGNLPSKSVILAMISILHDFDGDKNRFVSGIAGCCKPADQTTVQLALGRADEAFGYISRH